MISLGHFNWPIEAAVFNKNHYWASREYADRFWPRTTAQRMRADDSSRCKEDARINISTRGYRLIQ